MKAIISLPILGKTQMADGFQGIPVALLPIANKPLIEYYLGICSMLKVTDVLVLDNDYTPEVSEVLGDGSAWGLKLDYRGSGVTMSITGLLERNSLYAPEEDCTLVFNGLFVPIFDYRTVSPEAMSQLEMDDFDPGGIGNGIFVVSKDKCRRMKGETVYLNTYRDFHECGMRILKSDYGWYPIPGYHVDNGVYTGMDVLLPSSCECKSPAIIGNHVRFGDYISLLGNVIVGNHVMIEKNTTIKDSIIVDNTYLGADLEISGKIVCRDRLIDPETGVVLRLDDERLLMDVRRFRWENCFSWLFDSLSALLIILLMTPVFLFFLIFGRCKSEKRPFTSVCGHTHTFTHYKLDFRKKHDLYFYKLMLDKYLLLFYIFRGDLVLFGESIERLPEPGELSFLPGVFCFSDTHSGRVDQLQMKLDDRFYRHNKGILLMIKSLRSVILARLFASMSDF